MQTIHVLRIDKTGEIERLIAKSNLSKFAPVRAGFVGSAHEYWYSSANPEGPLKIIS